MKASRLILLAVVLLALAGSAMTALVLSAEHDPELGETVHIHVVSGVDPGPTSTPLPSRATADPSPSSPPTSQAPTPTRSTTSKPAPDRTTPATKRPQAEQVTRTPPRAGVDDDDDDWDDADGADDDALDD